ncbi:putative reverse transcriptase domain-containing protein [Tanacetum coccineum]
MLTTKKLNLVTSNPLVRRLLLHLKSQKECDVSSPMELIWNLLCIHSSNSVHIDFLVEWTGQASVRYRKQEGMAQRYLGDGYCVDAIAKPVTKLTRKSVNFNWGEKEETAFHTLKQKLCSAPILALPEGSENFIVYCDASHKGLGVILNAQVEARKEENYGTEDLCSMIKNLLSRADESWFDE